MDERVTELEIKVAHLEHTLGELNDALVRQQGYIDQLERQVEGLKERLQSEGGAEPSGDPADEKPPHY